MARDNQYSFAGGEISPNLHARAEFAKYDVSVALAENTYVLVQGGIVNRPGTKFIMELPERVRLIPFKFSIVQTYVLAFGDGTMRVIKDGGAVLETAQNIVDVTEADPVVVEVTGHGFSNGDLVYIESVGGTTEINNKFFKTANVTADTFELNDMQGNDIDGSAYTAYTSGGTVERVYALTVPYQDTDISTLKYTQSFDVMTVCHPSHEPADITRTDHDSWTHTDITFAPDIATPTNGTVTPQGSAGTTTYNYQITAVVDETGEESLPEDATTATGNAALSSTNYNRVSWTASAGADRYNIYKDENGVFGYIGTAVGTQFDDKGIDADTTDTPPRARDPFDGAGDFPSVVTYFQQRRVFGNTNNNPQTVWMTQTGHYTNLNVSEPARDDDAITFTIAANQVNAIKAMVPLNDLLILTEDGSVVAQGDGAPLTPDNVQIKPQQSDGASDLPPIVSSGAVLFVEDRGRKVRDIAYTWESDTYKGNDLLLLAQHLLEDREIVEWAYQKLPNSLIWCVLSDGEGLVLTYQKDQNVFAWCRVVTDGEFQSVACIPEGDEDAVYFQVKRTVGGVARYYLERLNARIDTDVKDAFFVDCGLSYDSPVTITGATKANPVVVTAVAHGFSNGDYVDIVDVVGMTEINDERFIVANKTADTFELTDQFTGANIDGTAYTTYVSGGEVRKAVLTVTGLEHLEGEEVAILADGNVEPNATVTNGAITISSRASRIHVGLPYQSNIETLPVDTTDGQATAKKKNISKVIVRVLRSRGMKAGPDADTLREVKQRQFEAMGDPIELRTGFFEIQVSSKWGYEGKTYIRQEYPLPMTILGLSLEVSVGG